MFEELLGRDDYNKDISSLQHAQLFTDILIAHPDRISGTVLVMILSTSDDFALDSLSNCQHRLFDAGDVDSDVTMKSIEAEDKANGETFVAMPHQSCDCSETTIQTA